MDDFHSPPSHPPPPLLPLLRTHLLPVPVLLLLPPPSSYPKGTCVNVGCVPKKVMFNTASLMETLHDSHHFGIQIPHESIQFDWGQIKSSRDAYVARLNGIYGNMLKNSGVKLVTGVSSGSSGSGRRRRRRRRCVSIACTKLLTIYGKLD